MCKISWCSYVSYITKDCDTKTDEKTHAALGLPSGSSSTFNSVEYFEIYLHNVVKTLYRGKHLPSAERSIKLVT